VTTRTSDGFHLHSSEHRKQRRDEADEVAIDIEGTSYAPGLDTLWFVTKLYHFT